MIKKWISAINRFRTVIDDYDTTIYTAEALHRLVEVHYTIGLIEEAEKYAQLLGYNYGSSEWYQNTYSLFNKNYKIRKNNRLQDIKKRTKKDSKSLEPFSSNMKNKEIKREYVKKIQKLVKLNKFYYENNNPIVDDAKYDALKKDILELESKYPNLKDKNSPSVIVGFKPSKNFRKVLHRVPMLSLANAFDKNDLDNFEKKITNYLNQKIGHYLSIVLNQKLMGFQLHYRIRLVFSLLDYREETVKREKI